MRGNTTRLTTADFLAVAGLCTLVPLLLWRLVVAGQILQGPDAFAYFYPLYGYAADRLLGGELPLCNPHLFMGAPFLANPQAGVFYPMHWLLSMLPAPSLVSATLAIHYALAAAGTYLLLRLGLGRGRLAAVAGAVVFAVSGLMGAQAEHVNQVEALSWLPLQVLLLEMGAVRRGVPGRRRRLLAAGAGLISGLQLLIGHAQAVYICHATLLAYGAARPLWGSGAREVHSSSLWRDVGAVWGRTVLFVGGAALLGVGLAAVQLLPTLELMGLSLRAGGLDYRQAVSFSFGPGAWLLGLLPHYGEEAPFSEYVAYVGVVGLLLAALGAHRSGRSGRWMMVLVAAGGLLALGIYNPLYYILFRIVPGFGLFRVPARWLVLLLLGVSLLVAEGVDRLETTPRESRPWRRVAVVLVGLVGIVAVLWRLSSPRPEAVSLLAWLGAVAAAAVAWRAPRSVRPVVLVALLGVELALASQRLPYNQTTASQVYEAQRRSTQVLLGEGGLGRFLTVSEPVFESGDRADLTETLGDGLNAEGRYGLLVGAKWQEVLARNLALKWGLYAVDGYDGGVLPTSDFLAFQSLFVEGEKVAADGRLSEALQAVPDERLLALAGVEYLITDRVQDVWIDGVYYDLSRRLDSGSEGTSVVVDLPAFVADSVGIVVSSSGDRPEDGEMPARLQVNGAAEVTISRGEGGLRVTSSDGKTIPFAAVPDRPELRQLLVRVADEPRTLDRLIVEMPADAAVAVRGLSLVNTLTGSSVAVELDPDMSVLNLGDVRLSRFENSLPRAYFLACSTYASDREAVLARLAEPGFDPRSELVLTGDGSDSCTESGWKPVTVVSYEPERVILDVDSRTDGYVVLLDTYYPGWEARVDGEPVPVERANWFFRAVPVTAGNHRVEFDYRPRSLRVGAIVTVATLIVMALGLGLNAAGGRLREERADSGCN